MPSQTVPRAFRPGLISVALRALGHPAPGSPAKAAATKGTECAQAGCLCHGCRAKDRGSTSKPSDSGNPSCHLHSTGRRYKRDRLSRNLPRSSDFDNLRIVAERAIAVNARSRLPMTSFFEKALRFIAIGLLAFEIPVPIYWLVLIS